jgi:hypothetical protein
MPGGGTLTPRAFVAAFDSSAGARDNLVGLDAMRAEMAARGATTPAQQDKWLIMMAQSGHFQLEPHEGYFNALSPTRKDASITIGSTRYVYISRH